MTDPVNSDSKCLTFLNPTGGGDLYTPIIESPNSKYKMTVDF